MVASAAVTCHATPLWHGCSVAECYDLSLNRTKELVHEVEERRRPLEIRVQLRQIEQETLQGIEELEGILQ